MIKYKLTKVKTVCEGIYGQKLSDRTWRKWRSQLGFDGYVKEISEAKMEQLLIYSYLKRIRPYDKITLLEIMEARADVLQCLRECCTTHKPHIIPDQCRGTGILGLIEMVTGRSVSLATLYRWGEELGCKFSINAIYKKIEIESFISKALL